MMQMFFSEIFKVQNYEFFLDQSLRKIRIKGKKEKQDFIFLKYLYLL